MLGDRIALLRRGRGWSQTELARQLHISASAVGMYEQGRREPSVETLIAISQTFGVSLDYLLSGKPDTIRDVAALHRLATDGSAATKLTKEEMVCYLLCALLE